MPVGQPPPRSELPGQTDWRYRPVSSLPCRTGPTGFRTAGRSRVRARAANRRCDAARKKWVDDARTTSAVERGQRSSAPGTRAAARCRWTYT